MNKITWIITKIEISALPPSVNSMYSTGRNGQRYKSAQYVAFEQIAKFMRVTGPFLREDVGYECEVKFYGKWICKNGSLKKKDLDNMAKCVMDVICSRFPSWDDHQVMRLNLEKIHKDTDGEHTVVKFRPLSEINSVV